MKFAQNEVFEKEIDPEYLSFLYDRGVNVRIDAAYKKLNIGIYKCLDSGFRFFKPIEAAGDGNFYKELEKIPWYYQDNRWEFDIVIETINDGANILEIGCGKLAFLKRLKSKKPNVTSMGLELNDNAVMEGEKVGIKVTNQMIDDFCVDNEGKFDLVCGFQVLEHISDVDNFIKSSLKCLKPGGRFIFSVPNNDAIFFSLQKLLPNTHPKYSNQLATLALNMPPHHMGLWDAHVIRNLPRFFEMDLLQLDKQIANEGRVQLIHAILLNNHPWLKISKWFQTPFFYNILNKNYQTGDSILASFVKR
jgi:2-polyprenyl-3-methyl-5-hydroxy-6-metoxy-1,4-benzoquinol methylase